jgi:integrase
MQALTDTLIAGLSAPETGRTEIADARCIGLAIRVTAAGAKSFAFKYRMRGRGVQRVTLGTYPALSLSKARAAADKMRQSIATGDDPATERREQRTGGRTFDKLAARYLAEHAKRKKRPASAAADDRNLRLHVLPKWRTRDFAGIKRADVITLIEGIIADGKPTLANRVQALVSTIFSFAVDAGLRPDNPCARMKRRGVENVGERVLTDAELRMFWTCALRPEAARRSGLGLRLALLTGARIGEVAGISRDELHNVESPNGAEWHLPGARTKNKRDHIIPLAPLARATILELLALIEPGDRFLFPTRSSERSGPQRPNSLTQAMTYFGKRLARGEYGDQGPAVTTWTADEPTPHDLRRTCETRMAALGVPKEHRDRVLNHVVSGVGAKHYDKHDYWAEKLAALSRWESGLAVVLAGEAAAGTVVAFSAGRA